MRNKCGNKENLKGKFIWFLLRMTFWKNEENPKEGIVIVN